MQRLSPGQVRDAIIEFFRGSGRDEVTAHEVRSAVNASLGREVAASSVRSYIQHLERTAQIERVSRGRYRWVGK